MECRGWKGWSVGEGVRKKLSSPKKKTVILRSDSDVRISRGAQQSPPIDNISASCRKATHEIPDQVGDDRLFFEV